MLLGSSNSNFLIPNGTFIAELIIFIIILGIVAKFILPPIQKVMDERAETIRAGQLASDEGASEVARLANERAAVLSDARATAKSLLDEATKTAEARLDAERARGLTEHDRLVAAAEPGLHAEIERVQAEMSDKVRGVIAAAAESVMGAPVDIAKHNALISESLIRVSEKAEG